MIYVFLVFWRLISDFDGDDCCVGSDNKNDNFCYDKDVDDDGLILMINLMRIMRKEKN